MTPDTSEKYFPESTYITVYILTKQEKFQEHAKQYPLSSA